MSKRHADSTPDEKPAKRRRCEADEVSADPYDAVCCMCRENQQDSLGAILAQHFAPDTRNAGAAHVSARGGETERTLPAPLDVCDKTGRTPLMICAHKGHVGCLVLLLEAGAGLDIVTPNGLTALMCATVGGVACLKELLTRGASLAIVDHNGTTALHFAVFSRNNQADLVNMLLKHGASIEAVNSSGLTPLLVAFQEGNEPAVVALLEGGASLASVDSDGNTALHHVAISTNNNQADLVNMLLSRGLDLEVSNNFQMTPLHMAVAHNNKPAVVALLSRGASLATKDCEGETALHYAARLQSVQSGILSMLLKHGASIDAVNNSGYTPLIVAFRKGNEPAVVALLEGGASLACADSKGNTALHHVAILTNNNPADLVNMLLKHGASVEAVNNSGYTPLLVAFRRGNEPAVVALLEGGASLASVDRKGNTALHSVAFSTNNNQADLVNMLLKHGASIEAVNNSGR